MDQFRDQEVDDAYHEYLYGEVSTRTFARRARVGRMQLKVQRGNLDATAPHDVPR